MEKKKKHDMRRKTAAAVSAVFFAATLGACDSTKQVSSEMLSKQEPGKMWKLFHPKSSFINGKEFYHIDVNGENAMLVIIADETPKLYKIGRVEGKSAVIAVDSNKVFITYDGGSRLILFNKADESIESFDLGTKLKNPSIAARSGKAFIMSEDVDFLLVLDFNSKYIKRIPIEKILDNEGTNTKVVNPSLESTSQGVLFTAKGFRNVYFIGETSRGKIEIWCDDLSEAISRNGELKDPRMTIVDSHLCLRPSQNANIACMRSGMKGKVNKVIIVTE